MFSNCLIGKIFLSFYGIQFSIFFGDNPHNEDNILILLIINIIILLLHDFCINTLGACLIELT